MKAGFYPRLALDGIRKNKRMYLPYMLTCIGMIMMTYIINYLKNSSDIFSPGEGETTRAFMEVGIYVLAVFTTLFLFYTNSFLIRRRKKEFGLYNVLGMGKKNISILLLWETVFVALFSLVLGLAGGIAFSKLAELGFINIIHGTMNYRLYVSLDSIVYTVAAFALIFVLLYLNSMRQVWQSNAVSLLRSENTGEKPPKANWIFGLLGFILLGVAYYLALTTKEPVTAIFKFLIAVIMVIIATYLIMISGSVLLCRILQKKKNYYYNPKHFVSVSSMTYRMKRNGAGLASICILATMVLVMISSTSALFIGEEKLLERRYPRDINGWLHTYDNTCISYEEKTELKAIINEAMDKYGSECLNVLDFRSAGIAGLLNDGNVIFDTNDVYDFNLKTYSDLIQIYIIPLRDYNDMTGRDVTLLPDEALVYANDTGFEGDSFGFCNASQYTVKEHLKSFFTVPDMSSSSVRSLVLVVSDMNAATAGLVNSSGDNMVYSKWVFCFNTSLSANDQIGLQRDIYNVCRDYQLNVRDEFGCHFDSREAERKGLYELYGGLFYLGLILSIVFIFAAVLIIYYKQVSEGYEDQSRFGIMQKVGMTKKDIRKSINSQLLTVFFLPLFGAGLHLAFAFPIIEKLLMLFSLNDRTLFILTTTGSFLVFALFYVIVYKITSNAYYKIVSTNSND